MTYRAIRKAAGWSASKVAAFADVGPGLVRLFEIDPSEVRDARKRRALSDMYDALRICVPPSVARHAND